MDNNKLAMACFEVVAGVIPGQPIDEHTKQFFYTAEDYEIDRNVPPDQDTAYSKLSEMAHQYARSLENPACLNWVQVTFIWF